MNNCLFIPIAKKDKIIICLMILIYITSLMEMYFPKKMKIRLLKKYLSIEVGFMFGKAMQK